MLFSKQLSSTAARERVVIDPAVLVTALLSGAPGPAGALDRAVTHAQVVVTPAMLRELMTMVLSRKLDPYVSRERRDALLLRFAPLVDIVPVRADARASKGRTLLEAAVMGRADVILSDDEELLALGSRGRIAILKPDKYLR
jgi:putative PIN family toxin of toxin-antitoxin system